MITILRIIVLGALIVILIKIHKEMEVSKLVSKKWFWLRRDIKQWNNWRKFKKARRKMKK